MKSRKRQGHGPDLPRLPRASGKAASGRPWTFFARGSYEAWETIAVSRLKGEVTANGQAAGGADPKRHPSE